jgi:hypothetical protein
VNASRIILFWKLKRILFDFEIRPNYKLRNKCIVYIQIVAGINWGCDDEKAVLLGDA